MGSDSIDFEVSELLTGVGCDPPLYTRQPKSSMRERMNLEQTLSDAGLGVFKVKTSL